MSAHTPGPWELSYDMGSGRDVISSVDSSPVCTVRISWVGPEQYRANALLIAAAPELLSALVEAAELIEVLSPIEGDTMRRVKGAIAKASPKGLS